MRDKSVARWVEKYRKVHDDDSSEDSDREIKIEEDLADASTPLIPSPSTTSHQKWNSFKRKAPYYIPSSQWIPKYPPLFFVYLFKEFILLFKNLSTCKFSARFVCR